MNKKIPYIILLITIVFFLIMFNYATNNKEKKDVNQIKENQYTKLN